MSTGAPEPPDEEDGDDAVRTADAQASLPEVARLRLGAGAFSSALSVPELAACAREFHLLGTAVALEGGRPPPAVWTTFLAGSRLAKLFEAGLLPVSVVGAFAAVSVRPVCATEHQRLGSMDPIGTVDPYGEIRQLSDAHMEARRVARDRLRGAAGRRRLSPSRSAGLPRPSGWLHRDHRHAPGHPGPSLSRRQAAPGAHPHGQIVVSGSGDRRGPSREGDARHVFPFPPFGSPSGELLAAFAQGEAPDHDSHPRSQPSDPVTSDLSIDETLLLHSVGWEPVDLVCGASVTAIAKGTFAIGWDGTAYAPLACTRAVATAVDRIGEECHNARAAGIVGVKLDFAVEAHLVTVVMVGTSVRPVTERFAGQTFVSNLSARDFCLLQSAG